jgi:hypothetical protein
MAALEERLEFLENGTSSMSSPCLIEISHFERALSKIKPSVSEQVWGKCQTDFLMSVLILLLTIVLPSHLFPPLILFPSAAANQTLRGVVKEILVELINHHLSVS